MPLNSEKYRSGNKYGRSPKIDESNDNYSGRTRAETNTGLKDFSSVGTHSQTISYPEPS